MLIIPEVYCGGVVQCEWMPVGRTRATLVTV
ncbi:MAG: hypothetical protein QOK08_442 [Actinomycetota bacterium]|nr:hypothetical protein [Actinomycetota bacterium]